ncbi:MAG: division/cell wall cluster transcriptional repressor MraZ [Bacteroidota bacterium]
MNYLNGKYDCKVDANGRLLFPINLKKQLSSTIDDGFVIRESIFDPCLELFPTSEWEKEIDKLTKLNPFNTKDRILIKKFSSGMNVELDNNGRMLIPVDMKKNKKISKDIILVATINIIEIWDKQTYDDIINNTEIDIVALAEERLGQITKEEIK